jgi:hypothetical protein
MLGERYGLARYLEIATPLTGCTFDEIPESVFEQRDRLLYRCPESFDDGLPLTWQLAGVMVGEWAIELSTAPGFVPYDIVFVDSYHTYASSMDDLYAASMLVSRAGALVVHDVLPKSRGLVDPEFQPGSWCGATFQAYVDFPYRQRYDSFVVDFDHGCGVILGPEMEAPELRARLTGERSASELQRWRVCHSDAERFELLMERGRELHHIYEVAEVDGLLADRLPHRSGDLAPGAWEQHSLHLFAERNSLVRSYAATVYSPSTVASI